MNEERERRKEGREVRGGNEKESKEGNEKYE